MRSEFFFPKLSDRELREDWEAQGALDARQRANAIARAILEEHQPDPIPPEFDAEIRAQFDIVLPDSD
jgi:trimethylamine--corrinoid protein Co-methyltransferase